MVVPSIPTRVRYDFPTGGEIEELIRVYIFQLYWLDTRHHKRYVQRSVVATIRNLGTVADELQICVDKLGQIDDRDYFFELTPIDTGISVDLDSTIIALTRNFTIAKRSTTTHEVFADLKLKFCPTTGANLQYFITAL